MSWVSFGIAILSWCYIMYKNRMKAVLTLQTVNVIKLQIHFIFWTVINHIRGPLSE